MEPKERINLTQVWLMKNGAMIMFVVIALYALFMTKSCMSERAEKQNLVEAIKLENQKVQYWQDATGKEHAKVTQIQLSHEQMDVLYKGKLDSMAKLLGIKEKQITQITTIGMTTTGKVQTPVETKYTDEIKVTPNKEDSTKHDTTIIRIPYFTIKPYKDKWLSFDGYVRRGILNVDYSMTDSLTLVTSYKNRGLFGLGRRDYFLDIAAENPNTRILNAKGYKLDGVRENKMGFGIIGGYGVSLVSKVRLAPYIGVGFYYRIL